MLDQFKAANIERPDLDELVELSMFGRQFRAEFELQNIPVPQYVDDNLRSIRNEINARLADKRAARKREVEQELESLKSRTEKRAELEKELVSLTQ